MTCLRWRKKLSRKRWIHFWLTDIKFQVDALPNSKIIVNFMLDASTQHASLFDVDENCQMKNMCLLYFYHFFLFFRCWNYFKCKFNINVWQLLGAIIKHVNGVGRVWIADSLSTISDWQLHKIWNNESWNWPRCNTCQITHVLSQFACSRHQIDTARETTGINRENFHSHTWNLDKPRSRRDAELLEIHYLYR